MRAHVQACDLASAATAGGEREAFARDELVAVRQELQRRGIEVQEFHAAEVKDGLRLALSRSDFVAGDLMVMWQLLRFLDLEGQLLATLPEPLTDLLHRQVWVGTLAEIRRQSAPADRPLFVKPRYLKPFNGKRFKGQVLASLAAVEATSWVPNGEEFICSEVVRWVSEYRAYVCDSRIVGLHQYMPGIAGLDLLFPEMKPDLGIVEEAIRRLDAAGLSVAGYCLDFGRLDTGQTALVEANDGLALTNYGLSAADYTDLHLARWQEITGNRAVAEVLRPA